MRLLKIWGKIKKPLLVGFILLASLVFSFVFLHLSGGKAGMIFNEILSAFSVLAIFSTTLSVALFNYVDSISKDVSVLDESHSKIKLALQSLSNLKKEVVVNAGLIVFLLIMELTIKGFTKYSQSEFIQLEYFNVN